MPPFKVHIVINIGMPQFENVKWKKTLAKLKVWYWNVLWYRTFD